MKILQEGHVPVPWWLNQILSCRCGWTAQLEKGDEYAMNVELSATSASARCGTCGGIVTVLRSTVEGKAPAGEASRDGVTMLREDQLRHFTNCPRFDESPLKEMFQKEGQ